MDFESCGTCRFWKEEKKAGKDIGICRESPPKQHMFFIPGRQMNISPGGKNNGLVGIPMEAEIKTSVNFPPISRSEWCGKWRAKKK